MCVCVTVCSFPVRPRDLTLSQNTLIRESRLLAKGVIEGVRHERIAKCWTNTHTHTHIPGVQLEKIPSHCAFKMTVALLKLEYLLNDSVKRFLFRIHLFNSLLF